jgi:hypothetical protein
MNTNGKTVVDLLKEQLQLTDEQVKKLEKSIDNQEAAVPQNIVIPVELDTDDHGYVRYSKQVTTGIPIKFNASGVITFPAEGTWSITVSINGGVVFHKDGVKAGERIGFSGKSGWGTSTLTVDAQWSICKKTHVSLTITI